MVLKAVLWGKGFAKKTRGNVGNGEAAACIIYLSCGPGPGQAYAKR